MDFPVEVPIEISAGFIEVEDRFGNVKLEPAGFSEVLVFGWSVNPVEEDTGDSVMRVIDTLKVIIPATLAVPPETKFRTPDGREWNVEGSPRDSNNGPWWSPGLVTVTAKGVEG